MARTLFLARSVLCAAPLLLAAPGALASTTIQLSADTAKCIHKEDALWTNGNDLQLWDCSDGDAADSTFRYDPDTGYLHFAYNTSKCVHRTHANWNNGNPVHLWDCNAGSEANKSWDYDAASGQISARYNTGKCIHKMYNHTGNGNPLHLWDCSAGGSGNKSWLLDDDEGLIGLGTPLAAARQVTGVDHTWTDVNLWPETLKYAALFFQDVSTFGGDRGEVRYQPSGTGQIRFQEATDGAHIAENVDLLALRGDMETLGIPGEVGSFTLDTDGSDGTLLVYRNNYQDPVLLLSVASNVGTQPAVVRGGGGNSGAFIQLREPDQLDGAHAVETIHYAVIEAGAYPLANGRVLAAQNVDVSGSWTDVGPGADFTGDYFAVTTVFSTTDTTFPYDGDYRAVRVKKHAEYLQAKLIGSTSDSVSGTVSVVTWGTGTPWATDALAGCERCPSSCKPDLKYGYKDPIILNARQGDLLVEADADGPLSGLFSALGQTYTHSAIFTDDGQTIRHNTMQEDIPYGQKGSVEILWDSAYGSCSGDAWFKTSELRDGRPGTCSMNPQESACTDDDGSDYDYNWDETSWSLVRATPLRRGAMQNAADQATRMEFYYRFFSFRNYDFECNLPYAELSDRSTERCDTEYYSFMGTVDNCRKPGCMCSGFIARAAAVGNDGALDGTHYYDRADSAAALYEFHEYVYYAVRDELANGDWSFATDNGCEADIAHSMAQQAVNCFLDPDDCGDQSSDNKDDIWNYLFNGSNDWNVRGESISPDNLIENGTNNGYFEQNLIAPNADQGGWKMWPTGTGSCK